MQTLLLLHYLELARPATIMAWLRRKINMLCAPINIITKVQWPWLANLYPASFPGLFLFAWETWEQGSLHTPNEIPTPSPVVFIDSLLNTHTLHVLQLALVMRLAYSQVISSSGIVQVGWLVVVDVSKGLYVTLPSSRGNLRFSHCGVLSGLVIIELSQVVIAWVVQGFEGMLTQQHMWCE